jgi:MinD-like ATPase involved in chromosome partitioning or flagellar assembly
MTTSKGGRIITFYSYKGGTGRSMALANVAWILASQGKRVLMVDWDLEAPGLHLYVHPFLSDKRLVASEGLIDLISKFETAAITPTTVADGAHGESRPVASEPGWHLRYADISRYCIPLAWSFPERGTLDLLPAGRQDETYAARINSFNWTNFYDRLGGGVFLEAVKSDMRRRYDYIFIDSRTGLSDTAGVCTVQMPDTVVVCFTFNNQSIQGAAAVASSIEAQRKRADQTVAGANKFRIFPVATRVDRAERASLDQALDLAKRAFGGFIEHLPAEKREEYWGEVYVPYESYYAYQEILATVRDEPRQRGSVLTSFERIAEFVTGEEVRQRSPAGLEQRVELIKRYLLGPEPQRLRAILSQRPELQEVSDELARLHASWRQTKGNRQYLLNQSQIALLQANIELMIGMLEDREFREFWDRSLERLQQDARIFWTGVHAATFLIAVAGIVIMWLVGGKLPPLLSVSSYIMAALSGIAGSSAASLISRSLGTEIEDKRFHIYAVVVQLLMAMIAGAISAAFTTAFLINSSTTTALLVAFVFGFWIRQSIPERLEQVVATVSDRTHK